MGTQSIARAVCAVALLALAGCANLGAIREFGGISSDAAGYTVLTNEYASSPSRLKKFMLSTDTIGPAQLKQDAPRRQRQVERLQLHQAAVAAYMKALADLSSDEIAVFDTQIKGLTDKALESQYIDAKEAGAINALGGAIANAATDFYRQRKLKQTIGQANEPLQSVMDTLDVLVQGYRDSLTDEDAAVRKYYQTLYHNAQDENQNVLAEQLWSAEQAEHERIAGRIKAAEAYRTTLQKIAVVHQALYDQRDHVSRKEVQRQIREYAQKIHAAYKAVRADG